MRWGKGTNLKGNYRKVSTTMAETKKPVRSFYIDISDLPEDVTQAYDKYNEIRQGIGKALKALGAAHAAMERAIDPYLEANEEFELVEGGSWKASYTNEEQDKKAPEDFSEGLKIEVFKEAYGSRHWRNQKKGKQSIGAKLLKLVTGGKSKGGKENRPLQ